MFNLIKKYGDILIIIMCGVVISFLYRANSSLCEIFITGMMVVSLIKNRLLPLCLYIISTILEVPTTPTFLLVQIFIVCGIGLRSINRFRNNPLVPFSYLSFFVLILAGSFLSGYHTGIFQLLQIIACWLLLVAFVSSHDSGTKNLLSTTVIVAGLSMIFIIYLQMQSAEYMMTEDGRMLFNEHVKTLAFALAYPALYIIWSLLSNFKIISLKTVFLLISLMLISYLLLLTYARGVLIALIIATMYLVFSAGKYSKFSIITISILGLSIIYVSGTVELDTDLIFRNFETGNGRTEIWINYYKLLSSGSWIRFLFGLGPGSVTRLTEHFMILDGYYVHSVILDYLFSLGLLGFIFIISLLSKMTIKLYKNNCHFSIGLLLLNCIMSMGHGTITLLLFYALITICILEYLEKTNLVLHESVPQS